MSKEESKKNSSEEKTGFFSSTPFNSWDYYEVFIGGAFIHLAFAGVLGIIWIVGQNILYIVGSGGWPGDSAGGWFGVRWWQINIIAHPFFQIYSANVHGNKKNETEYFESLPGSISQLLENLDGQKITASDIDARLEIFNVDIVKEICEKLYHSGQINRTLNYRYYVYNNQTSEDNLDNQVVDNESSTEPLEKEKPKINEESSMSNEKINVKSELKKYKEMLDEGLITQEQYDAKSNELLGL